VDLGGLVDEAQDSHDLEKPLWLLLQDNWQRAVPFAVYWPGLIPVAADLLSLGSEIALRTGPGAQVAD
jgi:hypothetical protein